MNRRKVLMITGAVLAARPARASDCGFEICKTDVEWRAMLSENEFLVLREVETERPFTRRLNKETRPGTYHCRGCDLPLYDAAAKYDSGTGWPSFFESLPDAVRTREDRRFIFQFRTEVHCRRCGGHLGHILDDGPEPTWKRHCLNGLSLTFAPSV